MSVRAPSEIRRRSPAFGGWLPLVALTAACGGSATPTPAPGTPTAASTPTPDATEALTCDVIIVGGGVGGLYSAYRLGPEYGDGVCLFEKEDRLGGRIYDVSEDGGTDGPWIGVGARRIMEGQEVLFDLADELGITSEAAGWKDDLITARGYVGGTADELNASAYPLLDDSLGEGALYDELRFGPERANVTDYPDFRSYVRSVVGSQGYDFLTDVFRFRADYEYPLDARGYLDYLDEEWDVCCTASYPIGGMSEFVRRMEAAALADGVRIFKSQAVTRIDEASGVFTVKTAGYTATAGDLIVAVPAAGFGYIDGNVATAIQAEPEFQQLIPVRVVTITQWWPSRWWETEAAAGGQVRRAWTTDHCLNHIEIPVDQYGIDQNVIRTVYDDDIRCVTFWEEVAKQGGTAMEDELLRGLQFLFPEVDFPAPTKTQMQVWPDAWYWLRAGSPFTNADVAAWAVEPLPGLNVSMVGEAYNPQRSGWSDGAYKSANATLNARFGFEFTNTATRPAAERRAAPPRRQRRSDGGH